MFVDNKNNYKIDYNTGNNAKEFGEKKRTGFGSLTNYS